MFNRGSKKRRSNRTVSLLKFPDTLTESVSWYSLRGSRWHNIVVSRMGMLLARLAIAFEKGLGVITFHCFTWEAIGCILNIRQCVVYRCQGGAVGQRDFFQDVVDCLFYYLSCPIHFRLIFKSINGQNS